MRKYTGLMAVTLILLAAGLVLTMQPGGGGGRGFSDEFISVNGESIAQKDFKKQGPGALRILQSSGSSMMEYPLSLGISYYELATNRVSDKALVNFVANRLLVKKAAADLGIYPSTEAAEKFIQETIFRNRDGEYDAAAYAQYIENIGNQGFDEKDFKALVAEYLVFVKTRDLIGGGLVAPREMTLKLDEAQKQKVDLLTVVFEADKFKEAIKPTEEEVKKYWNDRKQKYLTDRELKVSYVLAQASQAGKPVMPPIAPGTEPAVASKMRLDHQMAVDTYNEARALQVDEMKKKYATFIEFSEDTDYKEFEEPAKTSGFEVVTTEFFTLKNAPAELKNLNAARLGALPSALFEHKFGDDLAYRIESFQLTPDGYIAVRLDDEKKPEPKTFEAAKEEATKDLIAERAAEAMKKEAESAHKTLSELVKSGKTFEEAAKEKGYTVVPVGPFGAQDQPAQAKSAQDLFRVAMVTTPGEVAEELSSTENSSTVVFVKDRTIEAAPNAAALEAETLSNSANQLKYMTFQSWFGNLRRNADMKLPKTE
ncbi:SurA N-terminal domain-containing protein [Rubritalea squalenifaciens]|nr:SurA N-terminal domain-containing protein [Rubritalea squalenifaciens]